MTPDAAVEYIDEPDALRDLCAELCSSEWFALDTEFIREDTYWPNLCLIQVATRERVACIDPLALTDLAPLFDVLHDPGTLKVLHAAGQDLEIFHKLTGRVPAPLFDTQVAAPLLGFNEQAGFATLVTELLGIDLAKGHARTDWTERPLPEAALQYAADDVRYLVPLYDKVRDELSARDRLRWLKPEFRRLADPARYERPAADAWQRLRGIERLPARARAAVELLAEWREDAARKANVPRGRILRDDALFDIARAAPGNRRELGRIRSLRGATVDRHGDDILRLVAAAASHEPADARQVTGKPRLSADGEALVDMLSAAVRLVATTSELGPATLASRKELVRIAAGEPAETVLAGWRAGVVAATLDDLVAGRRILVAEQGRPRLVAAGRDTDSSHA